MVSVLSMIDVNSHSPSTSIIFTVSETTYSYLPVCTVETFLIDELCLCCNSLRYY